VANSTSIGKIAKKNADSKPVASLNNCFPKRYAISIEPTENIKKRCLTYSKQRQEKQPQQMASAGSFFKNPEGYMAGKLIDETGLKGLQVGGAAISTAHANFLINTGNATCRDILELMHLIQTKVFEKSGVKLEPEVHIFSAHTDC